MKKYGILFGMVMSAIALALVVLAQFNVFAVNERGVLMPMMQRGNQSSYEHVYLHVSLDDQKAFDLAFAKGVYEMDASGEDVLSLVQTLKDHILEDIDYTYTRSQYRTQMMTQYREDNYGGCHARGSISQSYEWIYIHGSKTQQEFLDLGFVEKVKLLDLNALSDDELLEAVLDIKLELIDQLPN